MYDMALLGGDARVAMLAQHFAKQGYRVIGCGLMEGWENPQVTYTDSIKEAVEEAKCIVGGVPMFKDGKLNGTTWMTTVSEEAIYKLLENKQLVFGGMIPNTFSVLCREKEIACFDYMKEDTIAIYNAIATAEGAIMEAIRNKDSNLHQSECLVLGYGKCARVLARKLKGLDAKVHICARSRVAREWAQADGFVAISFEQLKEHMQLFDYVFNTVPALVVTKEVLKNTKENALIIDIASGKGGVDYTYAYKANLHVIQCLGLPGKYAPRASAVAIANYIQEKLEQCK